MDFQQSYIINLVHNYPYGILKQEIDTFDVMYVFMLLRLMGDERHAGIMPFVKDKSPNKGFCTGKIRYFISEIIS